MMKLNTALVLGSFGLVMWVIFEKNKTAAATVDFSGQLPGNNSGSFLTNITDFFMGNSAIKNVDKNLLNHPQIQAFLRVIRRGEGTADNGGYNRLFGGGTFDSFDWHPNILVKKGAWTSTAAGAYQFLKSTWDETARLMDLTDFSPISQDLGALGRLAYRGAINDILAGNFELALQKTGKEWASLPGSPYGQPTISFETALNTFQINGGIIA